VIRYKFSNKNQPVLNFLNSVGGEFRKSWEDGYCFELPSGYCSEIIYNPQLTTVSEDSIEEPEKSTSIVPIKSNSSLINRIANQLYDIEKISQAIESQKKVYQNEQQKFIVPKTDTEKQLANLWIKLLRLEKVGIKDNFFDLGGNSLIAVQLMSRIRETFQVDLPISELLTVTTVELLALSIKAIQRGEEKNCQEHSLIDLNTEVQLDQSITPNTSWEPKQLSQVEAIFLTGATGFLGAFLLRELLQQTDALIYCLVRSSNPETGRDKIKKNLDKYQIWSEEFNSRIIPIPGDLSLPFLGLSKQEFQNLSSKVEIIYHNGALVNLTYPYSQHKAANVLGTTEVLRLATQTKVKPVHFVYTVAVFDSEDYLINQPSLIRETQTLPDSNSVHGGYSQSKWVAEKLVRTAQSRGVPVCIYRPGVVTGDSQTGVWNTDDANCRILRGIIQLGKTPNLNSIIEMGPVDYVAKALVYLSGKQTSFGKAFHLVNPQPISSDNLTKWIENYGYYLQKIDYNQWQQELINQSGFDNSNPLTAMIPLFFEKVPGGRTLFEAKSKRPVFDCESTLDGLADSDITCPSVKNLLSIYFSYLIDGGFLEKPLVKS
ncbi:MAG: thioester reductase domain-containing protein, partial [Rivularia sp. ALOHA_DT_140]|nr:thioester reductase domain-containing protein [Rivularia sp. ALOHA_DT_140]